ncbi:hypothetical protein ACFL2Q_17335, partial [Thermodesulfobacteriota bacterium]
MFTRSVSSVGRRWARALAYLLLLVFLSSPVMYVDASKEAFAQKRTNKEEVDKCRPAKNCTAIAEDFCKAGGNPDTCRDKLSGFCTNHKELKGNPITVDFAHASEACVKEADQESDVCRQAQEMAEQLTEHFCESLPDPDQPQPQPDDSQPQPGPPQPLTPCQEAEGYLNWAMKSCRGRDNINIGDPTCEEAIEKDYPDILDEAGKLLSEFKAKSLICSQQWDDDPQGTHPACWPLYDLRKKILEVIGCKCNFYELGIWVQKVAYCSHGNNGYENPACGRIYISAAPKCVSKTYIDKFYNQLDLCMDEPSGWGPQPHCKALDRLADEIWDEWFPGKTKPKDPTALECPKCPPKRRGCRSNRDCRGKNDSRTPCCDNGKCVPMKRCHDGTRKCKCPPQPVSTPTPLPPEPTPHPDPKPPPPVPPEPCPHCYYRDKTTGDCVLKKCPSGKQLNMKTCECEGEEDGPCKNDQDCPACHWCRHGKCIQMIEKCPEGQKLNKKTCKCEGKGCKTNKDCPKCKECVKGKCKEKKCPPGKKLNKKTCKCEPKSKCKTDMDCPKCHRCT